MEFCEKLLFTKRYSVQQLVESSQSDKDTLTVIFTDG